MEKKLIFLLCLILGINQVSGATYDYVVIGTGAAGAVFANVLSADGKNSVLVLEAGTNQINEQPIRDSLFAQDLVDDFFAQYFWQGVSVPQVNINGELLPWTTGRIFGGGTSINGLQYVRPTPVAMQAWQNITNNALWSPLNSINTFKTLENFSGVPGAFDPAAHGFSGPLDIRQAPVNPTQLGVDVSNAMATATNTSVIDDYNDPNTPIGSFSRWQLYQLPTFPYNRVTSASAFISPLITPDGCGINGRRLQVLFGTTTLKIMIKNQRAVGVHYLQDGCSRCVGARKAVILAAGINDAQLLMLSGVGPANVLTQAGITVKFDSPNVGLQLRNDPLSFASFSTPGYPALPVNDQQALYFAGAFVPNPGSVDGRGVQLIASASGPDSFSLAIIILESSSRGIIRIQSKDPLKQVLVDEGVLDAADLTLFRSIFRQYVVDIGNALNAINPAYSLVSPTAIQLASDDLLDQYIRDTFVQAHHMQSSCRMAPFEDGGVVDALGRVYGIGRLYIGDAQVFPFGMPGNTSAPAIMSGYIIAQQLLA